jgi:ring-1,2-phenylacetyl-CoA epoxidase subunit PaaC
MALDLIGQARALYAYAGEIEGRGRSEDDFAYLRREREYRNCLLAERPNGDFGHTMLRQLYFAAFMEPMWRAMTASSDATLAGIAAKAVKEVAYHRELASEWTIRLGDGTEESAQRMARGLDWCWRFIPELFEVDAGLQDAIDAGIAPDPRMFEEGYRSAIAALLAEAKLEAPADQRPILGGRRGHHSEHLGHILAVMQFLPRTYPDAAW